MYMWFVDCPHCFCDVIMKMTRIVYAVATSLKFLALATELDTIEGTKETTGCCTMKIQMNSTSCCNSSGKYHMNGPIPIKVWYY